MIYPVINSFTKTEASVSYCWEITSEEFDFGLNVEKGELGIHEASLIKDRLQKMIGFPTTLRNKWSYELHIGSLMTAGRVTISFYHKEGLKVEEKLLSSGFMTKDDWDKIEDSIFWAKNY